jgi:hypothetical protein
MSSKCTTPFNSPLPANVIAYTGRRALLRGTLPYILKNIIKTMNSIFGFGQ